MKAHPLITGCLIAVLVVLFCVGVSVIAFKFLGTGKMALVAGDKVGVYEDIRVELAPIDVAEPYGGL